MRTFRLAIPKDLPELAKLVEKVNPCGVIPPDLAYLAFQDDQIVAAVGIDLDRPDMVVLSGGVIHPDFYRRAFLVFRLQESIEDWLLSQGCHAYVFSINRRNKRMQRWMEKLGAERYAKRDGALWYTRRIGSPASPEASE